MGQNGGADVEITRFTSVWCSWNKCSLGVFCDRKGMRVETRARSSTRGD